MSDINLKIKTSFDVKTSELKAQINKLQDSIKLNINTTSNNKFDSVKKSVTDTNNVMKNTNEILSAMREYYEQIISQQHKYDDAIKNMSSIEQSYWDKKRQNTIESMTEQNTVLSEMKAYYTELEKTSKKEAELAELKKQQNQFSVDKNTEAYWKNLSKYIDDYKNKLISAETVFEKLTKLKYSDKAQTKIFSGFNNLDTSQVDKYYSTLNKAKKEIDSVNSTQSNKYYVELNKLLEEEYDWLKKIEDAKLNRYTSKGVGSEEEKQVITLKEQEYNKQLDINKARQETINLAIKENPNLANQEKEVALAEQRNKLESDYKIKINEVSSAMAVNNAKSESDLADFQKRMEYQMNSYGNRYSWVSGASEKLNAFKQTLANVTSENGKWYKSTVQADGQIVKTETNARALRLQFNGVKDAIQQSINPLDKFKKKMMTMLSYFTGGSIIYKFVAQIKDAFSYINQMDKYLTNVQIITGQTKDQVKGLTQQYLELADTLGTTSDKVAESAEVFYRQGKSAEETQKLIEASQMLSKLSGVESSQSAEYLTSIMNGYKVSVSDMADVVSKLVAIDNSASTSSAEMAEALQYCANSASTAGVSLNNLLGYVGEISAVTRQSASTVGKQHCRYVQKCA